MFVLDRLRTVPNWTIRLPLYHRGHLSLYPGTTVYLAPVFRSGTESSYLPEILGTTIQQNSWSTVYRVSIILHDAPGVLHQTLSSIAKHGGNVLNLDSTSTDQERYHHVELVVDFASLIDPSTERTDLSQEINGLLLADCSSHVVENEHGFEVRVRRQSSLLRLDDALKLQRANRFPSLVQEAEVDQDGDLTLSEPITQLLTGRYLGKKSVLPPLTYFVSSDTTERIFRVSFVPDESQVVWCAVRHYDRPGALSAITDKLRRSGITILSALNRVQRHQGLSWFEMIVSKDGWSTPTSSLERIEQVRLLLDDLELKDDYSPQVYFDRREADQAMREASREEGPLDFWALRRQPLPDWFAQKEDELETEPQTRNEEGLDRERVLSARRALSLGTSIVRQVHSSIKPRLFLSMEFTPANELRLVIVKTICQRHQLILDVVKGANQRPVVREEVISRISQATHFIGLWAPSPKDNSSQRCSPWLQWELGVASARRLPFAILAEQNTNTIDYERIHGERFYFSFDGADRDSFVHAFEQCLALVLAPSSPRGVW